MKHMTICAAAILALSLGILLGSCRYDTSANQPLLTASPPIVTDTSLTSTPLPSPIVTDAPPTSTPAPKVDVTPTPTAGCVIRGRVQLDNASGPGLEGVSIHKDNYPGQILATTDANGYYVHSNAFPGGNVWAQGNGYAFVPNQRSYQCNDPGSYDFAAGSIVCTPPPCGQGEVYYCPGSCPGGCGTQCATPTP